MTVDQQLDAVDQQPEAAAHSGGDEELERPTRAGVDRDQPEESELLEEAAGVPELAGEPAESLALRHGLELQEVVGAKVGLAHWIRADGSCSCGDVGCRSKGKHPHGPNGWQARATSDPHELRSLMSRYPHANIGILTGQASGIVVLDVDGAEGEASLAKLVAKYGPLPPTPTVRTSRGRHLYFRAGSVPLHCRAGARGHGLGKGLDLRAEGGFCVAPGSVHESGHVYAWEPGLSISEVALADVPAWIVERACKWPAQAVPAPELVPIPREVPRSRAEKWAHGALDNEAAAVRAAAPGTRNDTLNKAAYALGMHVAGGALDGGLVRRTLYEAGLACGLGEMETIKTIRNGMRDGAEKDQRSAPARDLPGYERPNGHSQASHVGAADSGEPAGPDEPAVGAGGGGQPGGSNRSTPEPAPKPLFEPLSTAQIFEPLPPQTWIVPGLQLGPGRPTLVAGYGASAKTISMQALALACAAGRPVWGKYETDPLVVLHVDYEQGPLDTRARYQRLALGHGITPGDLAGRLRVWSMPRLYATSKNAEDEYKRCVDGFGLVIVDSLRAMAPGIDENDSAIREVVDMWTRISLSTGAAVVIIHHAGKNREDRDVREVPRGSSSIFDASGLALVLDRKPGQPGSRVQIVKAPTSARGESPQPFDLRLEDVAIGDAPDGGLKVVWSELVVRLGGNYEADAERLLSAIRLKPGIVASKLTAAAEMKGSRAREVLRALADEGRVRINDLGKGKAKECFASEKHGANAKDENEVQP